MPFTANSNIFQPLVRECCANKFKKGTPSVDSHQQKEDVTLTEPHCDSIFHLYRTNTKSEYCCVRKEGCNHCRYKDDVALTQCKLRSTHMSKLNLLFRLPLTLGRFWHAHGDLPLQATSVAGHMRIVSEWEEIN